MAEPNIPGGCFFISRQLMNSGIMDKPPEYLKVWIYLLSNAYHTDKGNLKRGQGFTSLTELIDMLSYNVGYRKEVPTKKKVWGIIEWLRNPYEGNTKEPMIVTTKVTHGFVYTIVKYDFYQTIGNYEGNNEGTTKELRRERQGNNIKKNEGECNNENKYIDDFFDRAWRLYPNKKGKGQIKLATKKKIAKLGDEFIRCIERYALEQKGKDKQYMQHGSTFFNSGYVDYLDENYQQQKKEEPKQNGKVIKWQ